ncbi:ribonuclease P protein subunit p29-like [Lucilia cuprina]|uniref:ribonuclease P protein subunit p29 n=1 Tax=Lucilia cuprina TaxID=7375 RepID=UPI001F057920|nr:ribonuclease P protein subunit p29 [Lucilia cuprina]XP_046807719.1 ribonuclease P protein subunit p29-like [Lucilia cuprina]
MDHQVQSLKEYLTNMVVPSRRDCIDINPEHITMLQGSKSKKQLSRKRKTQKSTTLNRREYAQLGLHTLPTRQMKYNEALPLHRLWKGYMKEHLGLREGDQVPRVYDAGYDAFSKLLVKTDLHGAKMYVMQSKCPTLVGLSGIVVLDTKNVLKLLGKDDCLRTIPKSECVFGMKLGNMEFTIFGKHLCIRPAERSVKKIKNFIEPFE